MRIKMMKEEGSLLRKQSFIKGTMILLAAGIINRILGFIPRITLPRVIGAEGVGLYQLSYPFLIVIVTIITGGIPLAIAKLVAEADSQEDDAKVRKILTVSLIFTIGISLLFTLLCILFAPWITTHVLTDSRVYLTFLSMAPMIPVIAVSSVFRGYFQGKQNMIPTAASGIIETLVRIVAMLTLSYLFLPKGIEYAAAGAMLGVVAGEFCGFFTLFWHYWMNKRSAAKSFQNDTSNAPQTDAVTDKQTGVLKRIMGISIPVTAGRLVGSLSYLFESILTMQSLAIAGIATGIATAQYGALQGMIIPIIMLPGALTYSLAVSLVPSLSEAAARKDSKTIHKRLHQAIRLSLVSGAPFAIIMFVLAEPLCLLLYNNGEVANMLKWMAPVALFIYIQAPLQAALQALNEPGKALLNTFIGAAIKLILIVQLASNPDLGIYGALIAIMVNILVVTILHLQSVIRVLHFRMSWLDLIKVGASMIIMGAVVQFIFRQPSLVLDNWARMLIACTAGLIIYLVMMFLVKLVDRHDIIRIPIIGKFFQNRAS
ncbi:stage V sporulation protein B [Paenibacillus terrigena]|uniref:stage V sporulation protein B n=1 Tax=Paenibacillus terrigena TaxID=369333 RepID=UPI00037C9747|nr:stage V sporulation protein B [Paenibacillus terrigena]